MDMAASWGSGFDGVVAVQENTRGGYFTLWLLKTHHSIAGTRKHDQVCRLGDFPKETSSPLSKSKM